MDQILGKHSREIVLDEPDAGIVRLSKRRKRRKGHIKLATGQLAARQDSPHDSRIEEYAPRRDTQHCETPFGTVTNDHKRVTASFSRDHQRDPEFSNATWSGSATASPLSLSQSLETDCGQCHHPHRLQTETSPTPLHNYTDAIGKKEGGSAMSERTVEEWESSGPDKEQMMTEIEKYADLLDPRIRSIVRKAIYHVDDDTLGPAIIPPSGQVTPPPEEEYNLYNPKFGEEVEWALRLSTFTHSLRRRNYGEEIASQWNKGSAPEEAREKWRVLSAKHQAELDELSDD